MSGPRPLLLLALLCASVPHANAQYTDEVHGLSEKARALQPMGAAPGIVYIGDSHTVGTFGREIDAMLRATYPSRRIETYASCGSAPNWFLPGNAASGHTSACGTWFHSYSKTDPSKLEAFYGAAPTPLIGTLLASHPETVIVALGSNLADWKKGGVFGLDTARTLADAIAAGGARCVWIGPPDMAGHIPADQAKAQMNKLNDGLRQALGDACTYVQSRTTYDRSWFDPMKMHYPRDAAKVWALQVGPELRRALGSGGIPAAPAPAD